MKSICERASCDQAETGQAGHEAGNIERRIDPSAHQIAKGEKQIVSKQTDLQASLLNW
jgi:hypothetical protein